jgi:SPX domain protein involved in polyphosphate accumulation
LIAPTAYAGEILPAGSRLSEESYVFTIDEATSLMERLKELEEKEKELVKLRELEQIRIKQIDLFKSNEEYYNLQIDRYKELDLNNQKIINKYQKRNQFSELERAGTFILGFGLAFGSIYAADKLNSN